MIPKAIPCTAEAAENAAQQGLPARTGVVIAPVNERFAVGAALIHKPTAYIVAHVTAFARQDTPVKTADASSFAPLLSPIFAVSSA